MTGNESGPPDVASLFEACGYRVAYGRGDAIETPHVPVPSLAGAVFSGRCRHPEAVPMAHFGRPLRRVSAVVCTSCGAVRRPSGARWHALGSKAARRMTAARPGDLWAVSSPSIAIGPVRLSFLDGRVLLPVRPFKAAGLLSYDSLKATP